MVQKKSPRYSLQIDVSGHNNNNHPVSQILSSVQVDYGFILLSLLKSVVFQF